MRNLSLLKDQLTEDAVRAVNRLHRLVKTCFPEYSQGLYRDISAPFSIAVLKEAPLPCDIVALGEGGAGETWKKAASRGPGTTRRRPSSRRPGQASG